VDLTPSIRKFHANHASGSIVFLLSLIITVTNAPWRVGGVPEGILQLHENGHT